MNHSPTRLLIIGEQRSGTTLLADLFNAQPKMHVEVGRLGRALEAARRLGVDVEEPLSPRARHVIAHAVEARPRLDPEAFTTVREFVCASLDQPARGDDRVVGSKEHGPHELMEPLLGAGLRVLYIVRDVRDVILSRFYRGDPHLDQKILTWKRSVREAGRIRHQDFHLLRYEDLVRDPRGEFERVESALRLGLRPRLAEAWSLPAGRRTNTSFGQELRTIDATPVERWRAHEDEPWVRYAASVASSELAALGYEAGPGVPFRERLDFGARWARVLALHAAGRVRRVALTRLLPPLSS